MISQATVYPECSQTCPRVVELEGKVKELEEELVIREEKIKRLRRRLRSREDPMFRFFIFWSG